MKYKSGVSPAGEKYERLFSYLRAEGDAYYCGEGAYEISAEEATAEECESFLQGLRNEGFWESAKSSIGDSDFYTYTDGNTAVYTALHKAVGACKAVVAPKGFLPEENETPDVDGDVTVTQLDRLGYYQLNNGAPGICNIVKLADGRFAIIDGGPDDRIVQPMSRGEDGQWREDERITSHDKEDIYNFLLSETGGKKPVIALWIITHAHLDHIGLATKFIEEYRERIDLEVVGYNFPDFDTVDIDHENPKGIGVLVDRFKEAVSKTRAKTWIMRSGQRMKLAGCILEVLYTHEDTFPHYGNGRFPWCNHMSAAVRFIGKKRSFTALGDCESRLCRHMAERYGKAMKSDILQVTHHGANGGYLPLYRLIDPDICFWTCSDYAFYTNPQQLGIGEDYAFNAYLRDERVDITAGTRPRRHCCGGETLGVVI